MKELLVLILLGLRSQVGDSQWLLPDTAALDTLASDNAGTILPNFGALLSDPVIMSLGETPADKVSPNTASGLQPKDTPIHPVNDVSSGVVTDLQPGDHIDRFGVHGHMGQNPVVHTADGRFLPVDSPLVNRQPHGVSDLQLDIPIQPVNNVNSPAVIDLQPGDHIDRFGEHGHMGQNPVVHTSDGRFLPIDSPLVQGQTHGVSELQAGTLIQDVGPDRVQTNPGVINVGTGTHIDFTSGLGNTHHVPPVLVEPAAGNPGTHNVLPLDNTIQHVETLPNGASGGLIVGPNTLSSADLPPLPGNSLPPGILKKQLAGKPLPPGQLKKLLRTQQQFPSFNGNTGMSLMNRVKKLKPNKGNKKNKKG